MEPKTAAVENQFPQAFLQPPCTHIQIDKLKEKKVVRILTLIREDKKETYSRTENLTLRRQSSATHMGQVSYTQPKVILKLSFENI